MPKKTAQIQQSNEGIVFSDSEPECEAVAGVHGELEIRVQENVYSIVGAYKTYMSEPSFINSKGDPTTNIVDLYTKKCYHIPDNKIRKFMKIIEIMRRKNLKMMIYEKQSEYSGIMEDFDVHLNHGGESPITKTHYHRLCIMMFRVISKFIEFPDASTDPVQEFYVAFTKKPKLVYNSEGGYYKDGRHMLIPGIQINRGLKKLINDYIIKEKLMEKVFSDIVPHESTSHSDFLDKNSAHVGTFFVGSASKLNTPAYLLDALYKVRMTIGDADDIIPIATTFDESNNNTNLSFELSLNWANSMEKGGVVRKKHYDVKPEHRSLLEQFESKGNDAECDEFDENNEAYYNEMSILNVHDPDVGYIKSLLDILHPSRSEKYQPWFNVLCALAGTSSSYKSLGEHFSRKSPEKFDAVSFESTWDSITSKRGNSWSIGSLHYWAKMDNPDRYEEVRHRSLFNVIYKKIYDPMVEGLFEHYDIAEILHKVLKDKFVYDKYDDEGGTWYEFILDDEPMRPGELYKWRKYNGKTPNSLLRYMSVILPNLFGKVLARIKASMDEATEGLARYHNNIYKNFVKTCRSLKNANFKRCVGMEAEQLFESIGFSERLDSDPNLNGVANGVLQLGSKSKLITGYHGYLVSKFTNVAYHRMDPFDDTTHKVLIALRNLFPDDEPDTFDYIMHYLASTLDGNKKESIMLLLVGKGSNGKSFLVELHKGAIGSVYGVKMPLAFLTSRPKDAESATPALMQLKDAHFAYYSESSKFEILNMAKIKEFTGQETLAGRKLHQDYVNFKPKCHHLVSSNNDFEVQGTDHGTWRRLDYMTMKIKFCNQATDSYDKANPYERIADPTLGSHWAEDPKVLSAYLGILVYYYESLHNKYGGKVRNVPHPHVIKETENFRNRQDKVNNFLNSALVKCVDEEFEMPMTAIRERYIRWHESMYPGGTKDYQRMANDQLENSKLQKFIKKTRRGSFINGYKVLDIGEEKADGEEYYMALETKRLGNSIDVIAETSSAYYTRLCAEHKHPAASVPKKAIPRAQPDCESSDSDIDMLIQSIDARNPDKKKVVPKSSRSNNVTSSSGISQPKRRKRPKNNVSSKNDRIAFASMGGDSTSDGDGETTDSD
jgi:phage/plasmid-associated DNA primase